MRISGTFKVESYYLTTARTTCDNLHRQHTLFARHAQSVPQNHPPFPSRPQKSAACIKSPARTRHQNRPPPLRACQPRRPNPLLPPAGAGAGGGGGGEGEDGVQGVGVGEGEGEGEGEGAGEAAGEGAGEVWAWQRQALMALLPLPLPLPATAQLGSALMTTTAPIATTLPWVPGLHPSRAPP